VCAVDVMPSASDGDNIANLNACLYEGLKNHNTV
jgi:hypothetical protein